MKKFLIFLVLTFALTASACAEDATITLADGNVTVTPATDDVRVEGSVVTLRDKGTYTLTGELIDGQIIVDAGGKDEVTLILNGVRVANAAGPALTVENAKLTTLVLAEGTENALISGEAVEDVLSGGADPAQEGGAIHARDDLRVEGTGSLFVGGYLNNGIHTSNDLTLAGGNLTVEAVNHGVKGKNSVTIEGGTLTVRAGKDGVTADDEEGDVTVSGGEVTIVCAGDGISAEDALTVSGGTLNLTAGGGSAGVTYPEADAWGGWLGGHGPDFGETDEDGGVSTKGLKSGASLTITGGEITIDAADDAVHTNGDLRVEGGMLTLSSGDDGLHADASLTVADGSINVLASYEAMEANQLLIEGGELDLTSADDGLNAYGGSGFGGLGSGMRGGMHGPGGIGGDMRGTDGMGRGGKGARGGLTLPDGASADGTAPTLPDSTAPAKPDNNDSLTPPDGTIPEGATPDITAPTLPDSTAELPMPTLRVTGGTIHVNAEGDGLDSNGDILIEGGDIVVDGPLRSGNGAIDAGTESGGQCVISGGTVLAIGAAGMSESFDGSSTQCSFAVTVRGEAGSELVVSDSAGNELCRHTALKAFSSAVFSCPALAQGETYAVSVDGESVSVEQNAVSVGSSGGPWRR